MYAAPEQKFQLWLYMWLGGPFFVVFTIEEELTLFWHPVGVPPGKGDGWTAEDTRGSYLRVSGCQSKPEQQEHGSGPCDHKGMDVRSHGEDEIIERECRPGF
jgi:hypothetical protein